MKNFNTLSAKLALDNSAAKMYKLHRDIMSVSFNAINHYKRIGDSSMVKKFRKVCLTSFISMKKYENILIDKMK